MLTYQEAKKRLAETSKIPYPQVMRLYPNEKLAQLLYDSYAGMKGELTAITQYIYENMTYSSQNDVSQILRAIAIEEMKHLQLIGDLLQKLGKKPVYQFQGRSWVADWVNAKTGDFKKTMQYNMEMEDAAIYEYQRAMMATKNMSIRRLLDRIILDERTHKEIFQKMID